MVIEPLRLIGMGLFVLSIPVIKWAYDRILDQDEKESPDLGAIFRNQLIGRVGLFFFLAGLVLTINGGTVQ